mgnify:CR=1 FL=1
MIIDSHLHLDDTRFQSALEAATQLDEDRISAGITNCLVLHMINQGWTIGAFIKALDAFPNLYGLINLSPFDPDSKDVLKDSTSLRNIIGLKLHPRIQKFSLIISI